MRIGRHSYFLGTDKSDSLLIKNFSSIAGGVYIHGGDNHACIRDKDLVSTFDFGIFSAEFTPSGYSKGRIEIGNDVWIGEDVQILTGVTIGDGAIIGAHAVIAKDVPSYAVVVGNPQVVKRFRFSKQVIKKLLKISWWDWSDLLIRERLDDFRDVKRFVEKYYGEEKRT